MTDVPGISMRPLYLIPPLYASPASLMIINVLFLFTKEGRGHSQATQATVAVKITAKLHDQPSYHPRAGLYKCGNTWVIATSWKNKVGISSQNKEAN